jgi:predicted PurR-regulated permease PerM
MERIIKLPFYAKASLLILAAYAFISMMYIGRNIILPIIFAFVFAIVLHPVESFLIKLRLGRVLSIAITIILALLIVAGLSMFIILQVSRFTETLPELVQKFDTYLTEAVFWVSGFFDISTSQISAWIENTKAGFIDRSAPTIGKTLLNLGNLFVVILLIPVYIFMALYYEPIILEFFRRSFGHGHRHKVSKVISEIKTLVQKYLTGLFIETVIIAVLNTVALIVLGVEYAILLGIIAALLNLIPYIGGILGAILPATIALVTLDTPWVALWVMISFYVIQLIDNNLIVPLIVASKVKINALVSVIVVLAFGALWGIPGMFISIPLTAIVKLIADHIDPLKPLGFLLGDAMPGNGHLAKGIKGKKFVRLIRINPKKNEKDEMPE